MQLMMWRVIKMTS